MKQITLYSEGTALGNPASGGYATILLYNTKERILSGRESRTTNNRMELLAVIQGLSALKEPCEVEVISSASYVCKGINTWLENWRKRDFIKVKNLDLWQEYLKVSEQHSIVATLLKERSFHAENERCHTMANAEAEKFKTAL